jgi:hypothetical protein
MENQLKFVEDLIKKDIEFYEGKRNFNRKATFRLTIFPASLSAISTIAIGIQDKIKEEWLLIIAIIASGTSSILGAWQSLFANKTLWAANNATLADLYKLDWKIQYRKADVKNSISKQEVDDYYLQLMKIHDEAEAALQLSYKSQ